ncbi:MAG TPA: hypothetical protein GXZ90_00270 [Clostridiales bacterium]|nr:hypothetical protein [Clostridiales bacterium]
MWINTNIESKTKHNIIKDMKPNKSVVSDEIIRNPINKPNESAAEIIISDKALELLKNEESREGAGDQFNDLSKCIKIAMRIVSGGKVPLKDEQFLQEKNPELYSMAKNMRILNKDKKEYDSVLEDEDENPMTNISIESYDSIELGEAFEMEE